MKRNIVETILGAFVILVALSFFIFGYGKSDKAIGDGYEVTANFSSIGGLRAGDAVQISGVKVGSVQKVELDPDTYLARVTLSVQNGIELPEDTAALISSEGLLGGLYMALEPGGQEELIKEGGRIQYTQAPQNLEQLLGQFIFSMQDSKDDNASAPSQSASSSPISTPADTSVAPTMDAEAEMETEVEMETETETGSEDQL